MDYSRFDHIGDSDEELEAADELADRGIEGLARVVEARDILVLREELGGRLEAEHLAARCAQRGAVGPAVPGVVKHHAPGAINELRRVVPPADACACRLNDERETRGGLQPLQPTTV